MLHTIHTKGSVSELLVALYFLNQGHQVYFPVVRQGKVDLIVENFKDKTLTKVQVKTASWNTADGYKYLQCRTRTTNKFQRIPLDGDYDCLVVVYENEMWVIPSSIVSSSNITLRDEKNGRTWDKYKVKP
jgi:hypothetical protein